MHVLVTGAAGFIGQHVLSVLRERDARVTAIDRLPPSPVGTECWITADLSHDDPAVDAELAMADAVVHLAGCPGVRTDNPDVDVRRHRDNVLAGARVLESARRDAQVVVASSSSVYGGAGDPRRARAARETDPLRPRGGYARSKVVLEQLAQRRAGRGGRTVVARPFTVAGPGQRRDMAISQWIEAVRRGCPVTILGDPRRCRDVTDVRQVAEALVRLAERDVAGPVNLGTGTPRTLTELVAAVARSLGGPLLDVRHRPAHRDEVAATLADPRRCIGTTGLRLVTDIDELIRAQAEHALSAPLGPTTTTTTTTTAAATTTTTTMSTVATV